MGVLELVSEQQVKHVIGQLSDITDSEHFDIKSKEHSIYFGPQTAPDLLLVKEVNQFPRSLDQIENIERWFPEKKLEIPVIGIEVKRSQIDGTSTLIKHASKTYGEGSPLPKILTVVHSDAEKDSFSVDDRHQYLETDIDNQQRLENDLSEVISTLLEEIDDMPIEELPDVEDALNSFKPTVFHFNEILRAFEANQNGPLIVLLSVFFESHCYSLLEAHLEEIKPNEHAGLFIDGDSNFEMILDACRFYRLIGENEYTIIDLIRRSRNKYAHELERYHSSQQTPIEDEDRLEDAIAVYEDFIGVENSMLE